MKKVKLTKEYIERHLKSMANEGSLIALTPKQADKVKKMLDMERKISYEQGKKDADKLTDKEVEKIKQFCFNDGRDSGRIATLKEVCNWLINCSHYSENRGHRHFVIVSIAELNWLEQQLKEAKGE